mgnify:CR=1 FL=1
MEKIELDIIITPEFVDDSRVYSITSIQVPNVVTQGKTVEEAKKRLREALELYFEEMPEEKNNVIKISRIDNNAPMISGMSI